MYPVYHRWIKDLERVSLPSIPEYVETKISNIKAPLSPAQYFTNMVFPYNWLANELQNTLFPGNAPKGSRRAIRYSELNEKIDEKEPGYEPMSEDVEHHQIETKLGTTVGVHIYPPKANPEKVFVFLQGNTRPARYMNKMLEALTYDRSCAVIARDFVGYDLSSRVPNENGALEIAALANELAVYEYVKELYPDAEIIYVCRSIGCLMLLILLGFIGVTKVILCVPFGELYPLMQKFAEKMARKGLLGTCAGFVASLVLPKCIDIAFPKGCKVDELPDFETQGFQLASAIEASDRDFSGKSVLMFEAKDDDWIPQGQTQDLAAKLNAKAVKTKVVTLEGDHKALPWDEKNSHFALDEIKTFVDNGL